MMSILNLSFLSPVEYKTIMYFYEGKHLTVVLTPFNFSLKLQGRLAVDAANSSVLPTYYQHQHQSSSSSSTTTTTTLPPHTSLPPPQHQHQHSNTTNTTSLPATDSTSSSPRGSQHSSRSSGAHSTATAHSNAPLHPAVHGMMHGGPHPGEGAGQSGGILGCVWTRAAAAPPHTAPVTPASTTPRDSGLQQAIERVGRH